MPIFQNLLATLNTWALAQIFADTTASTSKTTGSGQFGGGLGVAGSIFTNSLSLVGTTNAEITLNAATNNNPSILWQEGGTSRFTMYVSNSTDSIIIVDQDASNGVQLPQNDDTWNVVSDARYEIKQNARNLTVLDRLEHFRLIQYGPDHRKTGIIAQELYECFPTLVHKGDDDKSRVIRRVDEAGTWTAPAEPVGYIALGGVKELLERVIALEAKIAKLEKSAKGA